MTKIFGEKVIKTSNIEMETTLREHESLLERVTRQLKAILAVTAYGQDLSNKEEDY